MNDKSVSNDKHTNISHKNNTVQNDNFHNCCGNVIRDIDELIFPDDEPHYISER